MSRDFNGSTDYIEVGSAVVTAAPLSMACWFNGDSAATSMALLGTSTAGNPLEARINLAAMANAAGQKLRMTTHDGTTGDILETTAAWSVGAWEHACGVWTSSTSRKVFLNGGNSATSTASVVPVLPDRTNIGARHNVSGRGSFFDGLIAEAAIWNAALTDDEVLSLARGFSPKSIRPQSLVLYCPLVRDVVDLRGNTLTVTGTTAAVHPRIIA